MRKVNWWTVLLILAVAIAVVWFGGRWLLRMFLGIQGARG